MENSFFVKRIVRNVASGDVDTVARFYEALFGLDRIMDLGWISTLGAGHAAPVQISVASQGGSDTPVPDLSIEVDDLDGALGRVRELGLPVEYGPVEEPWGVRRFYIRDPAGQLLNIVSH